ncbi:MAG: hypothetical protein R3E48_16110 [Burkholderiaceae bacterium]
MRQTTPAANRRSDHEPTRRPGPFHTPLLGLNPLPQETDQALHSALEQASQKVRAFDPELIVIFGPDHYNGFFHDLMPPFCVVGQAEAIGDYGTPNGPINIDEDEAFGLRARWRPMASTRRSRAGCGSTTVSRSHCN